MNRIPSLPPGRLSPGLWLALLVLGAGFARAAETTAATATAGRGTAATISFNRDIRPILADNCLACHGPDKSKRKGGLRLDLRDDALARLESGHRAVVPGNPGESHLLRVVTATDDDERMPPARTGKRLTGAQVALLRDWITQGAVFEPHWAYVPPDRPALPAVRDPSWPRTEIDRFIQARLDAAGLAPSPESPKPTLLRRVTLDLTGLPPGLAELDDFLADESPDAYERVVDRLLASTAYGERQAQQWLDLARYADSDGYHADTARSMWQYRDYVIRSFNDNKPFDQFTIEQLAGDLLPNPTVDQRIATAFNRNGMSSTEGGADPDEYLNKYVTDRVNTFGTVFLGSSTACTECHDHKYDPFTQREYYELYDFFNRIPERGLDSDPAPPFIKVPTAVQSATLNRLTNEVAGLAARRRAVLERKDPAMDSAQVAWEKEQRDLLLGGWTVLGPTSARSTAGATLQTLGDFSVLASGTNAARDTYDVMIESTARELTALRLEALLHDSLPLKGASRSTNGNFVLTGFKVTAESADPAREPAPAAIQWGNWSALGPFKAATPKEIFEKAFINETQVDLSRAYEDDKLRWKERPEWKDGTPQAMSGENQVTYLHRTLAVPSARYVRLGFGGDGGMQLWLNGVPVENGRIFRRVAPAPDEALVLLKPGTNTLLLKVHPGLGTYGFLFARPQQAVTNYPVDFNSAFADYSQKDSDIKGAIDDQPATGWAVEGQNEALRRNRQAVFLPRQPVIFDGGVRLRVRLEFQSANPQHTLGRFRLAVAGGNRAATFAALPAAIRLALFPATGTATEAQKIELRDHHRDNFAAELRELNPRLAETRKAAQEADARIPTIRVMDDTGTPRATHIRVRGDYRAKGEIVTAAVPRILPPLPADPRTNRLTLARWLTDPRHPLLGRVTVNRHWALFFGTGLVKTGNEFGSQGEGPSHPELLDWLAREFIDTGWNLKALHKKIAMSATYRQSSRPTPELLERDPQNRLLARGPRSRLSAEVIRDCALDYSGLLDRHRAPGGPSVRPYQPAGLWEEKMFGGNTYVESKGADLFRRSLYTLWKRTVLNPMLMTFDAPDRAICTEQRSQTCTPLQAFVTLNERTFVEAARALARRVLREGGSTLDDRITFACRVVLARPPTARERAIFRATHEDLISTYQYNLKAALDLLATDDTSRTAPLNELDLVAWTGVANVLLNLDETITKE